MKNKILLLVLTLFLFNCKRKPDIFIDGKPYYINERCVKTETTTKYEYHYGYSFIKGKYCWHLGNNTTTKCIEKTIDTVEVK